MLELLRKLRGDAAALPPRASGRQIARRATALHNGNSASRSQG